MKVLDPIIALLQGEMTDPKSVNTLMQSLAKSDDAQKLLVRHIAMMRKLHALGAGISPSPAADASLLMKIAQLQGKKVSPALIIGEEEAKGQRHSFSMRAFFVGILLALVVGIGVGHLINKSLIDVHRGDSQGFATFEKKESGPSLSDSAVTPNLPPQTNEAVSTTSQTSPGYHKPSSIETSQHPVENRTEVSPEIDAPVWAPIIPASLNRLTLLYPNGNEQLQAGSSTLLKWGGIADTIPVVLQFSQDAGKSWSTIGSGALKSPVLWKVPDGSPQSECLIKVSQGNALGLLPQFRQSTRYDTVQNIPTFSADGKFMAIPDYGGKIRIWDTETGTIVQILQGHAKSVLAVALNKDGSTIVSTSLDGTVRVWDRVTGKEQYQIAGRGIVLQISWVATFSSTGDTMAVGNDDGSITLWEVRSGKELKTINPYTQAIRSLSYSVDGRQLFVCSTDGGSGIFDAETGQVIQKFGKHDAVANAITVSSDGRLAVTGGFDGFVKFWDVKTGRLIRSFQYYGGAKIGRVMLSSDDRFLAVGGFGEDVLLVDPQSGEVLVTLPINVVDSRIGAWPVFSQDSRKIVVTHEHDVLEWNLNINSDISDGPWSIK